MIKPGAAPEGKLVFAVPRANYILTIERKFAGKPVPGKREDHLLACEISSSQISAARPARRPGVTGVY
jgi:hypothetical protein